MALNIAELFGAYNQGTRALLEAAGLPASMYADTAAAAPAVPAAGPTGGAVAPPPGPQTPADYLAAAARYARNRPGGWNGLLEAAKGVKAVPGVQAATHGPRAGQQLAEFDLGHGRAAHVYFDPKTGKRQVVKFRR